MSIHRKAVMVLYGVRWFAFFAVLVGGMHFGYSWMWSWIPLAFAMAVELTASRRGTAAKTADGGAPESRPEPRPESRPAIEVEAPVAGRWRALNSPADKVPSHGTRAYGQAYAIDIVAEPDGRPRPGFGWWPIVRRNRAFPAFDAPVLAVADATVVRVSDGQRDHLSRNSFPALVYLLAEGVFRDMVGARRLVGNHVILDLGDGVYALYAHLRRGSSGVRVGVRVRAGDVLGRCGNSGNSSEPHVHFQLMDAADPDAARGIPFTWRGLGVPANNELFAAPEPVARPNTP